MQKWTVIIILSVYATSQLCSVLVYHFRSAIHSFYYYKQQASMQEGKQEKMEIVLSRSEYKEARRDEKEVDINGALYDIGSIAFNSDKVYLEVVRDDHETHFLRILDQLISLPVRNQNPTDNENLLWTWLLKIYVPGDRTRNILPATCYALIHPARNEMFVSAIAIQPPAQPPEIS